MQLFAFFLSKFFRSSFPLSLLVILKHGGLLKVWRFEASRITDLALQRAL